MSSNKTRNQSAYSYFQSLQKEYVVAILRGKIYPGYKDRKYYKNRVAPGKKEKILEVARKNNLPSIFDDKELLETVRQEIIPDWGLPRFTYVNEENKHTQFSQDCMNYFSIGAEVVINDEGTVNIGVVTGNDFLLANNMVQVKRKGESKSVPIPITRLRRVLFL